MDNDIMSLKHNLNIFKEENNKLKEKLYRVQKEMESKDLYIKELSNKSGSHTSQKPANKSELKKYIKELTTEIERMKQEKEQIMLYGKNSKLKELQMELRNTAEECKILKGMLASLKEPNGNEEVTGKITKKLQTENQQLINKIQLQKYELERLKESLKKTQSKRSIKIKKEKRIDEATSTKQNLKAGNDIKWVKQHLNQRIIPS